MQKIQKSKKKIRLEKIEEPEYYIKDGFRFVKDYKHIYTSYVKIRWKNK